MNDSTKNSLIERPTIVAVMGHIDHGKSTLLDYIRKTNVVAGEAGGITQHIAAYEIEHKNEAGALKRITFLDTPGHEAFSGIRKRGASLADIAVLVVSSEEGPKTQTLEALDAIKDSGAHCIIALSKIDRPNADPERTKQALAEKGVYVEGYGGDIPVVAVSGKTGAGVSELLDMILLVAELAEYRADPGKPAEGVVVEASRDPRKGTSATLIVTGGTLERGMTIAAEGSMAPVRRIEDAAGVELQSATFSTPVRITGFDAIPAAGAIFKAFKTKKEAEANAAEFKERGRGGAGPAARTDETRESAVIPVVLKADTQGSLEALIAQARGLASERAFIDVIGSGVGGITESDIKLAASGTSNAVVAGFNVAPEQTAKDAAARYDVSIGTSDIIYKLSEWLAEEVATRIPKITVEEAVGKARIVRVFSRTRDKQVIGGKVEDGALSSGGAVRILRRDFEIGRGEILELQQQKTKTRNVEAGKEFGALVESRHEIAPGDIVEAIALVEK